MLSLVRFYSLSEFLIAAKIFGMTPKVRKCTNFRVFSKAVKQRSRSFLAAFRASLDIGSAQGQVEGRERTKVDRLVGMMSLNSAVVLSFGTSICACLSNANADRSEVRASKSEGALRVIPGGNHG